MDSRERILTALNHREPDRVPFDLGGTGQTGMHVLAYATLRHHLGLPLREVRARQVFDQGAEMDEDVLDLLGVDARHVVRRSTLCERYPLLDHGDYWAYRDQWGILWCKPKSDGLYFDPTSPPLAGPDVRQRLKQYCWPDPGDPWHYEPLRAWAQAARAKSKLVVLQGFTAGILETYAWLRGYNDFFLDLGADPELAGYILDALVDIKSAYWERALTELGDLVDVVNESDDLGSQQSLLISPNTYRRLVKPRHKRLYGAIKRAAPHVKVFMHTCGAVRPLIPDLIEAGVDILNPVQRSARGMSLPELKRDFGRELCFWGGGVDAQQVLGPGTLQQIRDSVRQGIEALAPGGGFVFAADHVVQANVPPQNVMAMREAVQDFGKY